MIAHRNLEQLLKSGRADAEKADYVGEELNARQQVLLNLFKEEENPSFLLMKDIQEIKSFVLLVSALFLLKPQANKVRKGDITLPTRKEIGDFTKQRNVSDYLSQLTEGMPQKGVKA